MTEIKRPLSLQLGANPTPIQTLTKPATTCTRPTRPRTMTTSISANKRAAMDPGKQLPTSKSSGSLASSSSSTSSSSTSSSFSPRTPSPQTKFETPDSPSLILPYLYVGDQAQTQIDTISNLNISYVLSLQSLPKFLDSGIQLEESHEADLAATIDPITKLSATDAPINSTNQPVSITHKNLDTPSAANDSIQSQVTNVESKTLELDEVHLGHHTQQASANLTDNDGQISNATVAKELLPSMNSSKDYLVKFRSCVNRLIKGKCINISDTFEQYVDKFFDETHNFIEEARRNKCNILVHCKAGISRSPTIAIAYLMKWKQLHLQDAYDFVKKCRPQISPNLNFMGQLMNYERKLLQRGFHKSLLPSPTTSCLISHHYHAGPSTSHHKQRQLQQSSGHLEQTPSNTSEVVRADGLNSQHPIGNDPTRTYSPEQNVHFSI